MTRIIQRTAGAWGLTSARSTGFPLFLPGPLTGRNPRRRSNLSGRPTFRSDKSTRRLAPSSEEAVFQVFNIRLPSRPTCCRSFTLDEHRHHQTGGCPWLLTSDLYRLPIAHPTHPRFAASGSVQTPPSLGRPLGIFLRDPVESRHSLPRLTLLSVSWLTDITLGFAIPPVLDSPPSHNGAARLRWTAHFSIY